MAMDGPNCGQLFRQAVVPGSASGAYYIPVSNLDPSLSFSDLRAVARQVATVEKCFVYPNTPEGWVRVRGHENFEKVWKHLDGYKYNGTVMSASAQNENDHVYIWDVKMSPHAIGPMSSYFPVGGGMAMGGGGPGPVPWYTGGHSSLGGGGGTGGAANMGYYTMPAGGSSPSIGYGGAYYSGYGDTSASAATSGATYASSNGSSSVASSGYPRPAFSSRSSTEESAMGRASCAGSDSDSGHVAASGGVDGAAPWYAPYSADRVDSVTKYAGQPYCYYEPASSASASAPDMAATMVPGAQTVKVFVKNLSRHASHRELDTFLTKAAGGRHKLQENVRFPRSSPSSHSTSRQHAFLLFWDRRDALAALARLENSKLKGLAVEARFVNETVLPLADCDRDVYSYSSVSVGSGHATPTPDMTGNGTHSPALTTASSSAQSDGSLSHNLVVDGSSAYGRAKRAEEACARAST